MRLFLILLILFLAFVGESHAISKPKPKWKTAEVAKVVDNERFMLKSGKIIRIAGITSPNIFVANRSDHCYARPIYRTLDNLISGKKVKIYEDGKRDENGDFVRHVKLKDGTVLTKYLLEKGMGKWNTNYLDSKYRKDYEKATRLAQQYQLGVWRGCNTWNGLKKRRKLAGRYPSFWQNYHLYLANVSIGKVVEVISGNTFRLENGLMVKMIGVAVPNTFDDRAGYACFSQSSKAYLESLILGKKVRLVRDRSQLDAAGHLLRYVYLPQTKYRNEVFLNKNIVQNGYGKSSWGGIDDRFAKDFELIQGAVYQDPNGVWRSCVVALLNDEKSEDSEEEVVLAYDEDCRIKGNISGSKKNPVKTYHTPKSGWYKRIEAERCFETEDEASMEGFRKIK